MEAPSTQILQRRPDAPYAGFLSTSITIPVLCNCKTFADDGEPVRQRGPDTMLKIWAIAMFSDSVFGHSPFIILNLTGLENRKCGFVFIFSLYVRPNFSVERKIFCSAQMRITLQAEITKHAKRWQTVRSRGTTPQLLQHPYLKTCNFWTRLFSATCLRSATRYRKATTWRCDVMIALACSCDCRLYSGSRFYNVF